MAKKRQKLKVLEEYEENKPTGIEFDPDDESGDVISPYNPKLIRVDPKVYSVKQIVEMIEDNELDLAPDFQRLRVWKPRQKSLLIESLLLRITTRRATESGLAYLRRIFLRKCAPYRQNALGRCSPRETR